MLYFLTLDLVLLSAMKKPQTMSLQDQLLKSGLTSDAKAKQVKAEKRKQHKQQRTQGIESDNDLKLSLEQSRLQQIERDKELNQLRQQAEQEKALNAQIKELINNHRLHQNNDGISYQFTDQNKVKTLYVSEASRALLINGKAGIVKIENSYEIVPSDIAKKIQERNNDSLILLNEQSELEQQDQDPYSAYQIPDDLIW